MPYSAQTINSLSADAASTSSSAADNPSASSSVVDLPVIDTYLAPPHLWQTRPLSPCLQQDPPCAFLSAVDEPLSPSAAGAASVFSFAVECGLCLCNNGHVNMILSCNMRFPSAVLSPSTNVAAAPYFGSLHYIHHASGNR